MKSELFLTLDKLGAELGFRTIYTQSDKKIAEFIYDLVWLDGSDHTMQLAVETEAWADSEEVLKDFRKLMYCKAPVKLLVYSYGPQMREFHKQCENS